MADKKTKCTEVYLEGLDNKELVHAVMNTVSCILSANAHFHFGASKTALLRRTGLGRYMLEWALALLLRNGWVKKNFGYYSFVGDENGTITRDRIEAAVDRSDTRIFIV